MIDAETGTVTGTPVIVGDVPIAAPPTPDGRIVLVANHGTGANTISVIDTLSMVVDS